MNSGAGHAKKLRWWFWFVLLAPALIALGGTAIVAAFGKGLSGLFFVNILVALPLNFVFSNAAAKQLVLLHDGRGGSSPWMFLWGPLIFFLNVALVLGGCSAMAKLAPLW